jgi:hypothetical protein
VARDALRLLRLGLLAAVLGLAGAPVAQWGLMSLQSDPRPQEAVSRPRLMQPEDPGFAEHLAEGCPGDVDWSPCALALDETPDDFTFPGDGYAIRCVTNPDSPETMICNEVRPG